MPITIITRNLNRAELESKDLGPSAMGKEQQEHA